MSDFLFSLDTLSAMLVAMAFAAVGTLLNHDDLTPYKWIRQLVSNATTGAAWGLAVSGVWSVAVQRNYPLSNRPELMWTLLVAGSIAAPSVMGRLKRITKERVE
jgi:hypothetical protein